jgi:hypothetical protein
MDVSRRNAGEALSEALFQSAFSRPLDQTTPPHTFFDCGKTIDWVFTRGSVKTSCANVRTSVTVLLLIGARLLLRIDACQLAPVQTLTTSGGISVHHTRGLSS